MTQQQYIRIQNKLMKLDEIIAQTSYIINNEYDNRMSIQEYYMDNCDMSSSELQRMLSRLDRQVYLAKIKFNKASREKNRILVECNKRGIVF